MSSVRKHVAVGVGAGIGFIYGLLHIVFMIILLLVVLSSLYGWFNIVQFVFQTNDTVILHCKNMTDFQHNCVKLNITLAWIAHVINILGLLIGSASSMYLIRMLRLGRGVGTVLLLGVYGVILTGLYYLTPLGFGGQVTPNTKLMNSKYCVELTTQQLYFARATIILPFVLLVLLILMNGRGIAGLVPESA
jgi:hypothetical protein